jgi:hypothetical protein
MAACLHHPGVPAFAQDAVGHLQAAVDKRRDARGQWNGRQIVSRELEPPAVLQKPEHRWQPGASPPRLAAAVREPDSSSERVDGVPLLGAADSAFPISGPEGLPAWEALAERLAAPRQARLPDRASPVPGVRLRAEPQAWAALGPELSWLQTASPGWPREPQLPVPARRAWARTEPEPASVRKQPQEAVRREQVLKPVAEAGVEAQPRA